MKCDLKAYSGIGKTTIGHSKLSSLKSYRVKRNFGSFSNVVTFAEMGVRGLQTYMEKYCKDVYEVVHIPEIAKKFKEEKGIDPIMLVDIESCESYIYEAYGLNWASGGEYKKLEDAAKHFVRSFQRIGVKLVAIWDGSVPDSKLSVWLGRKKSWMKDTTKIFDLLEQREKYSADRLDDYFFRTPPLADEVYKTVFESEENCEFRIADEEADEELAEYARTHACFAFLAKDSDFVIYDGPQYYLSIKDLDVFAMTTRNYDRRALARELGISLSHLPLLASLMGNDVVPYDEVKHFHHELCSTRKSRNIDYKFLFPAVAGYVKLQPRGRKIFRHLDRISLEVFKTNEFVDRLELSLENYFGNKNKSVKYVRIIQRTGHPHWDRILENAFEKHPECYNILTGKPAKIVKGVEDENDLNLLPSPLALIRLRKRKYGILFNEKPRRRNEEIVVQEWMAFSETSLEAPIFITPWYVDHPGLLNLWNRKNRSKKLEKARWRTFCKAVSDKLDHEEVMTFPKAFVFPMLALYFLNHEVKYKKYWEDTYTPTLKEFEIKAFVAQMVFVNSATVNEITETTEKLNDEEMSVLEPRAVQLSSLVQGTFSEILSLSSVCGLNIPLREISPANFFDGKLFHLLYNLSLKREKTFLMFLSELKDEPNKWYHRILQFITNTVPRQ